MLDHPSAKCTIREMILRIKYHNAIVLVAFIVGARQIVTEEKVTGAIAGGVIIAGANCR